jgi:chromatin assembly factor 1 subunit A
MQLDSSNLSSNTMIGCMLDESSLELSKFVDETFEKLEIEGCLGHFGP